MVYPYYEKLAGLVSGMNMGNFGLWYNKMIPLDSFDTCKASDKQGNANNAVTYYRQRYQDTAMKGPVRELLHNKHSDQENFCCSLSKGYESVAVRARLESPLITGIGESHPNEVSMVFDHNIGIPYVPASGIKGIVRFAHTLGLLEDLPGDEIEKNKNGAEFFNDEADWTGVKDLFGTQKTRGRVIFLDAYPEKIPELHVDIMNPHYGDYYSNDTNTKPPGDYLDPKPIKFLTVARGTVFMFRALVDREIAGLVDKVKEAFTKALTEEGVGAKTAVGYGMFKILEKKDSQTKGEPDSDTSEKTRMFKFTVMHSENLPGQIDVFLEQIRLQEDKELQKQLCIILLNEARGLAKKKKFSRALRDGKKWAERLKTVCEEVGVLV